MTPIGAMSSIEKFSFFMRLLAPPTRRPGTPGGAISIRERREGVRVGRVGALPHPSFTSSSRIALSGQPVNLFSDLLVHDMGVGPADGVSQDPANGREFRTAPLSDSASASSSRTTARVGPRVGDQSARERFSEANGVVSHYLNLQERRKQDLLNFLRSL
jgi:CxxC motif-containing protein (DUF1111 family)